MELDEVKKTWQNATLSFHSKNNNVMELIQNKSYGPLSELIKKFKKQLITIPAAIGLLIYQLIRKPHLFQSPSIWILYSLCFILSIYFAYNYYVAIKLQHPGEAVKINMELQLKKLQSSFKWYRIAAAIYYLLIPVAIELALKYKIEKDFASWGNVDIYVRMLTYIAGIPILWLLSRRWFKAQYKIHLDQLHTLIGQMQ